MVKMYKSNEDIRLLNQTVMYSEYNDISYKSASQNQYIVIHLFYSSKIIEIEIERRELKVVNSYIV